MAKEVAKGALAATIILVTLVEFFTLADEMRSIGEGQYGFWQIIKYVCLTTPSVFYDLFPAATLVGTMFSLGAMANNREFVAMRAAGVSVFDIIWSMLRIGLLLVGVAMLIGEFIAPIADRTAKEYKSTKKNNQIASWSIYGFWTRDGESFINIRQIEDRHNLGNVNIYALNKDHELNTVLHADKAHYSDGRWTLHDVQETKFETNSVVVKKFIETSWESVINPELLSVVVVRPNNLSIYGLAKYIQFSRENGQQTHQFELAFWRRIFNPVVTLIMLLIAVPFVLNVSRTITMGQRVLAGVIIGLSFIIMDRLVGHVGLVYNFDPMIAAIIPGSVFLLVAAVLIHRVY